jgi:MoaA/NifB/PqqE/SkfB family radical SAM enzyme
MTIIKQLTKVLKHPEYIPSYWRKCVREFTFFDLDYRFLNGYSFPPKSICFILTEHCNLKCVMCDIGQKNAHCSSETAFPLADSLTKGGETITLADWKRVVDAVVKTGWRPLLVLTGTEPLLYPQVLELVEYSIAHHLRLHITTNGMVLSRFADRLVACCKKPDSLTITVSLDGIGEIHDTIRGVPGAFDRALAGLEAVAAGKRARGQRWPEVDICCTISNYNYQHIGEFVEWFRHKDIDLKSITFSHLWFKDTTIVQKHNEHYGKLFPVKEANMTGLNISEIDMDSVHAQIQMMRAASGDYPFAILEQPRLSLEESRKYYTQPTEGVFHNRCLAPWRNVAINPRGEVIISPLCFDHAMGNITKHAFTHLWNDTELKRFRRELKAVGMYPACTRCCMLFDSKPKYYKLKNLM